MGLVVGHRLLILGININVVVVPRHWEFDQIFNYIFGKL